MSINISLTGYSFIDGIFFKINEARRPKAMPIRIDINARYINYNIIKNISEAETPSFVLSVLSPGTF